MAIEAQVISVEKPGENVNVLVDFKKDGKLLSRETIVFTSGESLDQAALTAKVNFIGSRLDRSDQSEAFAKTVVGTKITVTVTPLPGATPAPKV